MPKREPAATSRKSDSHLLSRRDFVTRTSLIGAGLVVGPLLTGCSDRSAEARSSTGTGSARELNKMKTRQLGTLQVSATGAGAMSVVAQLIRDVGFEPVDAGPLRVARYLEPFTLAIAQLAYEGNEGPQLAYRIERFGK
jgi:hypothetical protein